MVQREASNPRGSEVTLLRICHHKTTRGRWDRLIEEFGQPGYEDTRKDEGLSREVPARTAGAELEAISGEPDAIEGVTHAHHDRAEPDL